MSDWTRQSMCEGKEAFEPSRAHQVAKRMKQRGKGVSPYHCKVCGHWHVGRLSDSRIKRASA